MSSAEAFVSYLARWREPVDRALTGAGGAREADLEGYLYGPADEFTARGGKRVRPILCLLGCEAVGAEPERAMGAACAVEWFQSAALVHDDIADEGETRRGAPCVHRTLGVGLAVNVGDLALVRSFGCVAGDERLGPGLRARMLAELGAMMERTLEGQALDLGWARDGRWDLVGGDYLRMATLKTAHYSAASPLALGAMAGGGSPAQVEDLRAVGLDAGLAFQIQDDLLNLVGDGDAQGKDLRSDVTEGKRTLVALTALERLGSASRDELVGLLSSHETDPARLARAVELMEAVGAIDDARRVARELAGRAAARAEAADVAPAARDALAGMAEFFVSRVG